MKGLLIQQKDKSRSSLDWQKFC